MITLDSHKKFLKASLAEACKAQAKDEVPVGAVLVCDGKILARGHNIRESKQLVIGHAEVVVLLKAAKKLHSWRLQGCDLYITLEPCAMCAGALQQARVRRVYYGARDPKAGVVSLGIDIHQNPKLNHRFEMHFLESPECGKILSDFFKQKRAR